MGTPIERPNVPLWRALQLQDETAEAPREAGEVGKVIPLRVDPDALALCWLAWGLGEAGKARDITTYATPSGEAGHDVELWQRDVALVSRLQTSFTASDGETVPVDLVRIEVGPISFLFNNESSELLVAELLAVIGRQLRDRVIRVPNRE